MLQRNKLLSNEGFSLKYALSAGEGIQFPHIVAGNAEEASLD
jgi:hypothetical protein